MDVSQVDQRAWPYFIRFSSFHSSFHFCWSWERRVGRNNEGEQPRVIEKIIRTYRPGNSGNLKAQSNVKKTWTSWKRMPDRNANRRVLRSVRRETARWDNWWALCEEKSRGLLNVHRPTIGRRILSPNWTYRSATQWNVNSNWWEINGRAHFSVNPVSRKLRSIVTNFSIRPDWLWAHKTGWNWKMWEICGTISPLMPWMPQWQPFSHQQITKIFGGKGQHEMG